MVRSILTKDTAMFDGYFGERLSYWHDKKITLCERQNWRCCYCKFRVEFIPGDTDAQNAATIEHLNPVSKGGGDEDRNLVIACKLCNEARDCGNYLRFERVVQELLQNSVIRAAWHTFDDRHVDLLKKEISYARQNEKIASGKPSMVKSADAIRARHRALIKLVENGVI